MSNNRHQSPSNCRKMKLTHVFASFVFALLTATAGAQHGLLGEYYNGTNFESKVMSRVDSKIDFNWDRVSPAAGMNSSDYSIRWTGRLKTPKSGKYVFSATVDDGIRVWVGDTQVIDAWGLHDSESFSGTVTLEANKYYDLKVEYFNGIFEGEITLLWELPEEGDLLTDLFNTAATPVDAKYFFQPANKEATEPSKTKLKDNSAKKALPAKPKQTSPAATEKSRPAAATKMSPEMKSRQKALELKYIYFVKSKDIILPESEETLNDWVTFLQQQPDAGINIYGHTDDLGNADKNQVLSEQRAQIVADYLIAHGLDKSRIATKGFGGSKPIYVNPATEKERALNRRVEIRAK